MLRASASISDRVCSAAAMVFSPGAFITTTPRRVAAATSMLSTPVPALPTTRRERAAASTSSVTLVSERTTSPTAPASASLSSGTERPIFVSVFMPACRSISAQTGATGSEALPRENPERLPRPAPDASRHGSVPCVALLQSLIEKDPELGFEGHQVGDGRGSQGLALGGGFGQADEVEVVAATLHLAGPL